jgi:hypothetical protein
MKATHYIFIPEENVQIPLEMRGVVSLFLTRRPTIEELETCRWLMFTSEADWDPHSESYMDNELALSLTDMSQGRIVSLLDTQVTTVSCGETDLILSQILSIYSDHEFNANINLSPIYTHERVRYVMSQGTLARQSQVTKEDLSRLWGISLESAAQTLRVTTQKGVRNPIHPIV